MSVFLENAGGVADHGYSWRNILGHDRAHADDGVRADRQILADDRARADIGAIAYPNIAVAAHPRREGDIIADHAIMLDIGLEVGMEAAADFDIGRKGHITPDASAFGDLDLIQQQTVLSP